MNPDDSKLSALLRQSRSSPSLPPRFQENVWRRMEGAGSPARSGSWMEALAVLLLRPRIAIATAAMLLVAGVCAGALEGRQLARHDAELNYLASVAPEVVR